MSPCFLGFGMARRYLHARKVGGPALVSSFEGGDARWHCDEQGLANQSTISFAFPAESKSARNAIRLRRIQAFAVPIGTPSWVAISR
jgi:hypothetical protein